MPGYNARRVISSQVRMRMTIGLGTPSTSVVVPGNVSTVIGKILARSVCLISQS